tara:strand:+ start:1499 stop:1609 length:111 start_codon:yes stop_codon:yes gene_type:complete
MGQGGDESFLMDVGQYPLTEYFTALADMMMDKTKDM